MFLNELPLIPHNFDFGSNNNQTLVNKPTRQNCHLPILLFSHQASPVAIFIAIFIFIRSSRESPGYSPPQFRGKRKLGGRISFFSTHSCKIKVQERKISFQVHQIGTRKIQIGTRKIQIKQPTFPFPIPGIKSGT